MIRSVDSIMLIAERLSTDIKGNHYGFDVAAMIKFFVLTDQLQKATETFEKYGFTREQLLKTKRIDEETLDMI